MMKQLDIQYQALRAKKLWRMSNSASATGSKKVLTHGMMVSLVSYAKLVMTFTNGTFGLQRVALTPDNKRRLYHSKPISIEFTL